MAGRPSSSQEGLYSTAQNNSLSSWPNSHLPQQSQINQLFGQNSSQDQPYSAYGLLPPPHYSFPPFSSAPSSVGFYLTPQKETQHHARGISRPNGTQGSNGNSVGFRREKSPAEKPRSRFRFAQDQLNILERAFENDGYPEAEMMDSLARECDVEPLKVKMWFQNRRAKYRKDRKLRLAGQATSSPVVNKPRKIESAQPLVFPF